MKELVIIGGGASGMAAAIRASEEGNTHVTLIERLVGEIPPRCVRVAESGMHSAEAVRRAKDAGADAFLVGTALMRAASPGGRLRRLLGDGLK